MQSKITPPRLTRVVALTFVAILVFASTSYAQLLNLPQALPQIQFDSGGITEYKSGTQDLTILARTIALGFFPPPATPCFIALPPLPPLTVPPTPPTFTFRITVKVDNSGALVGGVPGAHDLVVEGVPAIPPLCPPISGPILTGEILELGYSNSPDRLEFRFSVTGGALAMAFGGISDVAVLVRLDDPPIPGSASPASTFIGTFANNFEGGATGEAGVTPKKDTGGGQLPFPAPTVVTSADVVAEATGPTGAIASYAAATATDLNNGQGLVVTCAPLSGSLFPLGNTLVTCTSDPDSGTPPESDTGTFNVKVQDTTPPEFFCGEDIDAGAIGACDIFGIQATGPNGASVEWDLSASDLVSGNVVVTCSLASGSLFAIGPTLVECNAKDAALNAATLKFTVTVEVVPPAPRDGCFIVNFREITYFKGQNVITSSDDGIRTKNGILVPFDPTGDKRWPYRPSGGTGYTTSRGTLFRIYGFQPAEKGQMIPDADESFTSYPVLEDPDTKGYYIDTGGPARVIICPGQLHNYVLGGRKRYGHMDGSTRLPRSQRNVPGIMLTHNSQILRLPEHVKAEMDQLGLIHGYRGVIDYIGFQLQGNGSAPFREFVDVEALFSGDSETDRQAHFKWGFHTATNTNFETFAGCNYVDRAPGNDAVRFRDVWVPNRSLLSYANSSWAACGSMEPAVNQKVRANYEVPFNAIQLLPTVNTNTDTLRLFYGEIRPVSRIRATAASE